MINYDIKLIVDTKLVETSDKTEELFPNAQDFIQRQHENEEFPYNRNSYKNQEIKHIFSSSIPCQLQIIAIMMPQHSDLPITKAFNNNY